jgi:hypothetical protein
LLLVYSANGEQKIAAIRKREITMERHIVELIKSKRFAWYAISKSKVSRKTLNFLM